MVTDKDAIENLGGTYEVSRLCRVTPPCVSQWKRRGMPGYRRQYLELLKPAAFTDKATEKRKAKEQAQRQDANGGA